jgi:glucose/arabinose dehydrogenase
MRSVIVLIAAVAFAACSASDSESQTGAASAAQGAPNTDLQPAFPGQTRAPEVRSGVSINSEIIARGLNKPWALEFLPDGRVLVSEQPGALRIVSRDGTVSSPIAGVPAVDARGQGGLLDLALSPAFASDRLVYLSFSEPRGDGANSTSVARGRLNDGATALENVQVIFRQYPPWRSRGHFGSRLVWDRDGHLFVTLGDRQQNEPRALAQDNSTLIGKVARINADGTTPTGNPFAGQSGIRAEIWSSGHRNIQGADLHPETGALWTIEHGPQGGDELNVPRAGLNYGWPIITYGEEYTGFRIGEGIAAREGLEQPAYYWDPVIAPGGMRFYRGDLFPWRGDLLISGLRVESLVRLELEGERVIGEERFALGVGRIRDVAEAPDGAIWLVTDESDGKLVRLTPRR